MADVFRPVRVSGQQCGALPLLSAKPEVFPAAHLFDLLLEIVGAMKLCAPGRNCKSEVRTSCPAPVRTPTADRNIASVEALMLGMSEDDENVYGDGPVEVDFAADFNHLRRA